jgi:hypothetical protein
MQDEQLAFWFQTEIEHRRNSVNGLTLAHILHDPIASSYACPSPIPTARAFVVRHAREE